MAARKRFTKEELEQRRYDRKFRNAFRAFVAAGFIPEAAIYLARRMRRLASRSPSKDVIRLANRIRNQQRQLTRRFRSFGFSWEDIFNINKFFYEARNEKGELVLDAEAVFEFIYWEIETPTQLRRFIDDFFGPYVKDAAHAKAGLANVLSDRLRVAGTDWIQSDDLARRQFREWRALQKEK